MVTSQLWYTRRNDKVQGPFPAGLISRYVLLGRFKQSDEVSIDSDGDWTPISDHPELIPDVMKVDLTDGIAMERLKAARRWADERGDERILEEAENRHEHVNQEALHLARRRAQMHEQYEQASKQRKMRLAVYSTLLVVSIVVLTPVGVYYASLEKTKAFEFNMRTKADCEGRAKPGINWRSCKLTGVIASNIDMTGAILNSALMTGADLSGSTLVNGDLAYAELSLANLQSANLENASMKGANLRGANLSGANLHNADLSYADLTGATLVGANYTGAKFDHAIWINQVKCLPGSVDGCFGNAPDQ